jgi:hypothetical protein
MSEHSVEKGAPVVLDLDDPYFHGQTLPDALRDYEHVHSKTGVCVKNSEGPYCTPGDPRRCPGDGCDGCRHCRSHDDTPSDAARTAAAKYGAGVERS